MWFNRKKKMRSQGQSRPLTRRIADATDTAIFMLAPLWGAQRRATRQLHDLAEKRFEHARQKLGQGWDSATDDRVRNKRWLASELSPDAFAEMNLEDLHKRSVELYRRNPIAHGAIEGRVTNEVGVGITPQARIRAFSENRNRKIGLVIEDVIERWSEHGVDHRRQMSLGALQRLTARTFATYGEVFLLFGDQPHTGPISLAIEVITPERVETPPDQHGNPNVRLGIEYYANDQIKGYWVRTTHPHDEGHVEFKHAFYPRFDEVGQPRMVHVFDPMFPGQSRGFPWLAAAHARLKDLDDFHEAELVAKQVEACFGLIFQRGPSSPNSPYDSAENHTSETTTTGRRLEDIEPAMIHYAGVDEEVKVVDPSRPGATFAPFLEASLRSIAAALNYPYELLAKNFFRTTFSSGRLAMLDGRMGFKMRRQVLIDQFLGPLYRRIVWEAVFLDELQGTVELLDYVSKPYLYDRHNWQGQGWGYVDPQKEVGANVLAKDEDVSNLATIYAEDGKDWEEELDQRYREKEKLVRQNVKLRALQMQLEKDAGLPPLEESGDKKPKPAASNDLESEAEDIADVIGAAA
jgi:lambda family phage portal protein